MAYQIPNITNALGKPVVEQKQDFFVLFEGAFSTNPEIIDQTSYKITYIVDGQGNISKPAEAQPSAFNIIQNYETNQNVTVILDQATAENSSLAGVKKITAIGQPIPYVFSSAGIGQFDFENRLVFRPVGAPPSGAYDPMADYRGYASTFVDSSTFPLPYNNFISVESQYGLFGVRSGVFIGQTSSLDEVQALQPIIDIQQPDTPAFISQSGMYQINSIPPDFQNLKFTVGFSITGNGSFSPTYWPQGLSLQFALQIGDFDTSNFDTHIIKGGQKGPTSGEDLVILPPISSFQNPVNWDSNNGILSMPADGLTRAFSLPNITLTKDMIEDAPEGSGGKKHVRIVWSTNDQNLTSVAISALYPIIYNFSFNVTQNPLPANYFAAIQPDAQSNTDAYWETASISGGSTIPNKWLTASAKLSEFYNNYYVSTNAQNSFGYADPNITFSPKPGDKIRFQFNPDNLFNIYDVKTPDENGGKLALLLDGLPTTASLNNFVLYRIDDTLASDMILDVKKTITIGDPENPFTGVILPQYPSDSIRNNINKILEKLKSEGIIKN